MHTTLALSHMRLGLGETRAHDVFVDARTGERTPYGHHPPATALTLAAAFTLTGSDAPAIARLTVIAFHVGSVLLLTSLLAWLLDEPGALLGGAAMATLPMGAYFGRMVNYEPLCLFGILLQLYGYVRFSRTRQTRDLTWLALGVVWGGLVDWPSFFFAAALAAVEAWDLLQRLRGPRQDGVAPRSSLAPLAVLVVSAVSTFTFDLWHLLYAGGGAMQAFSVALSANRPLWEQDLTVARFLGGQTDTFRRYFTEVGLLSLLACAWALLRPHATLSRRLFDEPAAPTLKRVMVASVAAALAYILAAPAWAMMHQYWQFYFLPAVAIAIALAWSALARSIRERPTLALRLLRAVVVLDLIIASAYWLHFRHTRPEAYTIETTAQLRAQYLTPRSMAADAVPVSDVGRPAGAATP